MDENEEIEQQEQGGVDPQSQQNMKENLQVAEKAAGAYFGGEAGAKAVDAAHKVPGVGGVLNSAEDKLAGKLAENDKLREVSDELKESGLTDKANQAIDAGTGSAGGAAEGAAEGAKAAEKGAEAAKTADNAADAAKNTPNGTGKDLDDNVGTEKGNDQPRNNGQPQNENEVKEEEKDSEKENEEKQKENQKENQKEEEKAESDDMREMENEDSEDEDSDEEKGYEDESEVEDSDEVDSDADDGESGGKEKKKGNILKLIWILIPWWAKLMLILPIVLLFIVIVFLIVIVNGDFDLNVTGTYNAPCQEVNVVGGDYPGTYSIEDYVAGVVFAESGGFNDLETLQAQAVAARTYAFVHLTSDCSIGSSEGSQVYKTPNELSKQAAENTKGIVLTDSEGNLINSEYDAFAVKEIKNGNYILKQNDQVIPETWVSSHISQSSLDYYNAHNHGRGMSQWGAYYLATEKKYTYQQILGYYYTGSEMKSSFIGEGGSDVAPVGVPAGILSINIGEFLAKNGSSVEALNSTITANVQRNGWGTRAGVVAASNTLINELAKYGVKLPYFYGGGHSEGISNGVNPTWGSPRTITIGTNKQKVNSVWPNGLDCSGFVSWAIYNGGFKFSVQDSTTFAKLGSNVKLDGTAKLLPGDVLVKKGAHVALVVGIDEANKKYITAEANGANYGVRYSSRSFAESGYIGVDMTNYYATHIR